MHPKQAAIIAAGRALFWNYGIKRVSLKEICETAGTSKVTFYRFFENKIALAKYLLDQIIKEGLQAYQAIMASNQSLQQKMAQLLAAKIEQTQVFSAAFIQDIYSHEDLGLKAYIESQSQQGLELFLDDLEQAQQRGELRADINRAFLRYQLLQLQVAAMQPELIQAYDSHHDLIEAVTRHFLYGLTANIP